MEVSRQIVRFMRNFGHMKKRSEIDWIFFDVGGVLVDGSAYENRRKMEVLRVVRDYIPSVSDADYEAALMKTSGEIGDLSVNIITELLQGHSGVKQARGAYLDLRAQGRSYISEAEFRPDARHVVEELSKNYRLGIIANQPTAMVDRIKDEGLAGFFSDIGVSQEHGFHKPDKRLFDIIFKKTGADPMRSVMIDDNIERGLLPAHELGMMTCWYKLFKREKPDWVDFEIRNLSALVQIFQ